MELGSRSALQSACPIALPFGKGLGRSLGQSTPHASPQPDPSHRNNTMSPWYTLPHLFSQHACEVGRGRDCPHFTEEEVEAHRGQVTCPRSQTAAKLEWGPEQALGSPGAPCSKCPTRGLSSAVVCTEQSSPRALSSLRAGPRPPTALPALQAPGHCSSGLRTPWEWGWGAGERRVVGVKKTEQNRKPRGWAGGRPKKGGCLHTRYIFLHTLVHTPRYSTCKNICYSHTRLLPGAPRASGGAGGQG